MPPIDGISSEKYRALADNSPNVIVRFDNKVRHLFVNSAGARLAGVSAEQLIGKTIHELGLPVAQTDEWELRVRTVINTGEILEVEDTMPTVDGVRYFQYRIAPERAADGSIVTAIVVGSDITEIRKVQESLREEKALLEVAQNLAHLGTWTLDMFTSELKWSEETYRIFGVPHSQKITFEDFRKLIHPSDLDRVAKEMATGQKGTGPIDVAYRIIRPDSTLRHLVERCNLVFDANGRLSKLEGVVQDVTKLKQSEQALQAAKEFLEVRIAERTRELRKKDHLLIQQSRLAAMGEMVSNIAHQWRQPLNTLALIVQELPVMYESGELDREYLEERTRKARQLITHMSQTIEDFRSFLRPNNDRHAAFNVKEGIDQAVNLFDGDLRQLDIQVRVGNVDVGDARGCINDFSQVLLNLLTNARDAFKERDRPRPWVVTIEASMDCDRVTMTFSDNAGGIPGEIIDRIFDPYFTTKGPDKGTGIGLFMAKKIMEEKMFGGIRVGNIDGGAEFRLDLMLSSLD